MESDQDQDAVEWAALRATESQTERVGAFLRALLDTTTESAFRTEVVQFLGTAELKPGVWRVHGAPDDRDWASLQVPLEPTGEAAVHATVGGTQTVARCSPLEARAFLLSANAIDTALGFVARVFGDVLGELTHQRDSFLAGETPEHPAQRASNSDAAASNPDGCQHSGLPPADSVPPYTIRPCPGCGKRMRAYPASAGGPEWNEVPA